MLDKTQLTSSKNADLNTKEQIAKFDRLANEWRDPNGKFKHVLAFNQIRLRTIEAKICQHFNRDPHAIGPLNDLSLLDIGCGAGLLCEPLAQQGAITTAIDGSQYNISIASQHAKSIDVHIEYIHCLASELASKGVNKQYDIVLNTEVIEHVTDQQALIDTCCQLLKPSGLLVMATLNRSIKSYIVGILGAEYVMRFLPIGTHEWRYFVKPTEMTDMLFKQGLTTDSVTGMAFNPLSKHWRETSDTGVNYILFATKGRS